MKKYFIDYELSKPNLRGELKSILCFIKNKNRNLNTISVKNENKFLGYIFLIKNEKYKTYLGTEEYIDEFLKNEYFGEEKNSFQEALIEILNKNNFKFKKLSNLYELEIIKKKKKVNFNIKKKEKSNLLFNILKYPFKIFSKYFFKSSKSIKQLSFSKN